LYLFPVSTTRCILRLRNLYVKESDVYRPMFMIQEHRDLTR